MAQGLSFGSHVSSNMAVRSCYFLILILAVTNQYDDEFIWATELDGYVYFQFLGHPSDEIMWHYRRTDDVFSRSS